MFKRSGVIVAIMLALTGCGDDSGTVPQTSSNLDQLSLTENREIRVIDGYLEGAEVYINRDGKGATNENLLGLTQSEGRITVPAADRAYPIIVKVIAGQTKDADSGLVTHNYEMASAKDSAVVTPFTTLAQVTGRSMDELARDLNVPSELLTGDYVAEQKQLNPEAGHVHLLARSVAKVLKPTLEDTGKDTASLNKKVEAIKAVADNITNNADDQVIVLNDNNEATATTVTFTPAPLTIASFLGKNTYYGFSTSDYWLQNEGGNIWQFDFPAKTVMIDGTPYSLIVNGNSFCFDGSDLNDDLFYMSEGLGLAWSVDGDIHPYTKYTLDKNLNGFPAVQIKADEFAGKTLYHLADTNRVKQDKYNEKSAPRLKNVAVTVVNENTGMINIGGTDYQIMLSTPELYFIKSVTENLPSLLLKNQDQAQAFYHTWLAHNK